MVSCLNYTNFAIAAANGQKAILLDMFDLIFDDKEAFFIEYEIAKNNAYFEGKDLFQGNKLEETLYGRAKSAEIITLLTSPLAEISKDPINSIALASELPIEIVKYIVAKAYDIKHLDQSDLEEVFNVIKYPAPNLKLTEKQAYLTEARNLSENNVESIRNWRQVQIEAAKAKSNIMSHKL